MALIGHIRKHMEVEAGDTDLGDAEGARDQPEDRGAQRFATPPLDVVGSRTFGVAALLRRGGRFDRFQRAAVGQ